MTPDSRLQTPGLTSRMQQVEALVRRIESLPDPEARASAVELVQALMEFHGAGLERMMEIVAEAGVGASAVFDRFAEDGLVGSLLLIYGLHPLTLEERVDRKSTRLNSSHIPLSRMPSSA